MTTVKPLIVLALDTSTDMLACAVAEWVPHDARGAEIITWLGQR